MERTKETLEARVRETPLVDRLKECQQRIGNMCAELRGPKMSIPVEYYDDDFYICTTLADAQATVEALQAQLPAEMQGCTILFKECEKGHGRLVATNWRDHGCQTCAMEALQRERDEWRSNAVAQEVRANDLERDCKDLLSDIDGERSKVGNLLKKIAYWEKRHLTYRELAEENMNLKSDELSALQALVRALPVVRIDLNGAYHDTLLTQPEDEAVKELLRYRATLDATTPAPDTSIVGKCEPPSQYYPNAQVRGDISRKEAMVSEAQRIQNEMNDLGEIYRLKGELLELRDQRDRLAELVRQAQPHVCSLLCPSVKARHELWTHTKLCLNMQAALTPAGLEAAKAIQAIDLKNNNECREQVANLQAELERVRGERPQEVESLTRQLGKEHQ